ncbi:MAG TPA: acetyl-CoA carboxylase carboxyl transferase subunit beta, partial [Erythrobacter sp.]|nr:acetyl-CoA carboxylase carboxyl transferase subunit beta [Erythrobacter sp.]
MNWFTRVRNSITSLSKRSTEKDLWVKCPSCQQMVFAQEYEDNSYVCPR